MKKDQQVFTERRYNIFRPLSGKRREMVAQCLFAIYDRLYGQSADYRSPLTSERVRSLFAETIEIFGVVELPPNAGEPVEVPEETDAGRLATIIIDYLVDDGWIERYYDTTTISNVYRLTQDGKGQTESLLRIVRPRIYSRHRNMRTCRNALNAFVSNNDVYELIDALDCASNVVNDLNEFIALIKDQTQQLMRKAAEINVWEEFDAFVKRFERDLRPQFTSEHVNLHRSAIRVACRQARTRPPEITERIEVALTELLPVAIEERNTATTYIWILERIEDLVERACEARQPELQRTVNEYVRRITDLLREVMSIRLLSEERSIEAVCRKLGELPDEDRETALRNIGWQLSGSQVRLVDPGLPPLFRTLLIGGMMLSEVSDGKTDVQCGIQA